MTSLDMLPQYVVLHNANAQMLVLVLILGIKSQKHTVDV